MKLLELSFSVLSCLLLGCCSFRVNLGVWLRLVGLLSGIFFHILLNDIIILITLWILNVFFSFPFNLMTGSAFRISFLLLYLSFTSMGLLQFVDHGSLIKPLKRWAEHFVRAFGWWRLVLVTFSRRRSLSDLWIVAYRNCWLPKWQYESLVLRAVRHWTATRSVRWDWYFKVPLISAFYCFLSSFLSPVLLWHDLIFLMIKKFN